MYLINDNEEYISTYVTNDQFNLFFSNWRIGAGFFKKRRKNLSSTNKLNTDRIE